MAGGTQQECSKRGFSFGWIVVLVLAALTPVLHAFIISTSERGDAASHALRIGSAAIGVRGIAGLCLRDKSRRWITYVLLYPLLIVVIGLLSVIINR